MKIMVTGARGQLGREHKKSMHFNIHKLVRGLLSIWALAGIICVLVTALIYLRWIGFAEQGDVQFSAVSWLVSQGYPLYTDIDAAERYSIQHGPIVYLLIGGIMKVLGPSYITAKLSGVAALLLTVLISWIWFSKLINKKDALCLLGLEIWILFHWYHIYLNRPDAMMLLCVVTSMYIVTTQQNRLLLILGTAIPLGIMVNLKIHGVIYFLPVIAIIYRKLGWRDILSAGGLVFLLGVAPFLLPQISFTNYLAWLGKSVDLGLRWKNFMPKVAVIFVLCSIPMALGAIYGVNLRRFYMRNRTIILTFLASLLIIAIVSSKQGSGTNHLIPSVPIFIYILLLLISDVRKRADLLPEVVRSTRKITLHYVLLALIFMIITSNGIGREERLLSTMTCSDHRSEIVQDIHEIERLYPGKILEVGYGNAKAAKVYRDFVPVPVFHGNPLLVDVIALDDMEASGLPIPPATIRKLEEGSIQVWLIPVGNRPFDMELFDGPFRQTFLENYTLDSKTNFFDIWVHKNGTEKVKVRM